MDRYQLSPFFEEAVPAGVLDQRKDETVREYLAVLKNMMSTFFLCPSNCSPRSCIHLLICY